MTSLEMLEVCLLAVAVYVSVVIAWLWARCGNGGMAGKPEKDEQSEPLELPRGRTNDSGLWVAEDKREEPAISGRTHPLYKKLASLSSEVSSMSRGQLKQRLRELSLEPR